MVILNIIIIVNETIFINSHYYLYTRSYFHFTLVIKLNDIMLFYDLNYVAHATSICGRQYYCLCEDCTMFSLPFILIITEYKLPSK